jgi:DNA-binding transcriptional ArsR family regulator
MPALTESNVTSEIKVAPSAPLELMWLMHNSEANHELIGPYATQEAIRLRFGAEAKAFWGDGVRGYTDLVILAHRSDTMFDLDLKAFFSRFEEAAADDAPVPAMLSETPEERKAFAERLRKLRTEPDVRARYLTLLQSVWAAACDEWETMGRSAAAIAAAEWRERLRNGAGFMDILERQHVWKSRPQLDELAGAAAADGRLVLSPGWFFGEIHVDEIEGMMYVGRGIRARDDAEDRRMVATHVASELKTLADPTRLRILLCLAREPASVTEVARDFKLSQPTVSGHVQLLREAGLLEEKTEGRSAKLSANPEAVRRLLNEAQDALLKHFK